MCNFEDFFISTYIFTHNFKNCSQRIGSLSNQRVISCKVLAKKKKKNCKIEIFSLIAWDSKCYNIDSYHRAGRVCRHPQVQD